MSREPDRGNNRLIRALQASPAVTVRHVWTVLSSDERTNALRAWLDASEAEGPKEFRENRQLLVSVVVRELTGFRPGTVLSWPVEKLCTEAGRLGEINSRSVLDGVVYQHHIPRLDRLQAPLLDAIGARHDNGQIEGTVADALKGVAATQLREGALRAWRAQPTREMAVYLLALLAMYPREWSALAEVLPQVGRDLADGLPAPEQNGSQATSSEVEPPRREFDEADQDASATATAEWRAPTRPLVQSETAKLSALDSQIILRIVASVGQINDAPDEVQLEQLLDELVHLSATRHQTFFHLGLNDAMRRHPVVEDLPASNRSRSRWYFAGYLSGLERRADLAAILQLFDESDVVQELGDTGLGPSEYAAPLIAGALIAADRSGDLLEFSSEAALVRLPALSRMVLDYATGLTRAERFTEALPLLELLWTSLTDAKGVLRRFVPAYHVVWRSA